jgi:hypothetical protein
MPLIISGRTVPGTPEFLIFEDMANFATIVFSGGEGFILAGSGD